MSQPGSTASDPHEPSVWTVRDYRRRWKPIKDRLVREGACENLRIRMHRCCSWLQRVESLALAAQQREKTAGENNEGPTDDAGLVCRWIALNALYARWDNAGKSPFPDVESLRTFTTHVVEIDRDGRIAQTLVKHRRLVMTVLEDVFLSRQYWKSPPATRNHKHASKDAIAARTWYLQQRWAMLLERALQRIYVLRCQLVHGGATCGGQLNRTALRRCTMLFDRLMPAIMLAMIDHAHAVNDEQELWGSLCYPPTNT